MENVWCSDWVMSRLPNRLSAKKCPCGVNMIRIWNQLLHCKQTLPAWRLSCQITFWISHIILYNVIWQVAVSVQPTLIVSYTRTSLLENIRLLGDAGLLLVFGLTTAVWKTLFSYLYIFILKGKFTQITKSTYFLTYPSWCVVTYFPGFEGEWKLMLLKTN